MKKIIIIPTFASAHFLEHWIPNMQEVLEPDLILIREALFPLGPENKGQIGDEFKEKWLYPNTNAGFDWEQTVKICSKYDNVVLDWFETKSTDANQCFLEAITLDIEKYVNESDLVFVLEPDVFINENDKEKIDRHLRTLEIGQGLKVKWVDFLETQFYTESVNISQPKVRRFVYRFDNVENFKNAMNGYMSQSYPKLKEVFDFFLFHYPWWNPEPYRTLRYSLIWRKDPQYWQDFENGLQGIRQISERYLIDPIYKDHFDGHLVLIRPSRQDEGRWAQFIDIKHPEAIKSHPNFIK